MGLPRATFRASTIWLVKVSRGLFIVKFITIEVATAAAHSEPVGRRLFLPITIGTTVRLVGVKNRARAETTNAIVSSS